MPRWDENVQAQSSPYCKKHGLRPLDTELPLLEYLDALKGHLIRADVEILDLVDGINEWIALHK